MPVQDFKDEYDMDTIDVLSDTKVHFFRKDFEKAVEHKICTKFPLPPMDPNPGSTPESPTRRSIEHTSISPVEAINCFNDKMPIEVRIKAINLANETFQAATIQNNPYFNFTFPGYTTILTIAYFMCI